MRRIFALSAALETVQAWQSASCPRRHDLLSCFDARKELGQSRLRDVDGVAMSSFDAATWWPDHVRQVFVAIGHAMRSRRLYREDLLSIPMSRGAILPDHVVKVIHVSGRELKTRKGVYLIRIDGPRFGGEWRFFSGQLEQNVLNALQNSRFICGPEV